MSTIKDESTLLVVIKDAVSLSGVTGAKTSVRRRFTPSRIAKGVEVIVMVETGSLNETLFSQIRTAMFNHSEIVNVESVTEPEKGSEIEYFVIEAQYDLV